MTSLTEIKVPDVGNVPSIDVVEVLIKPGDVIALDQTIAALETDKASMELPASAAGTVQQVFVKPGDKVSEGTLIATVLAEDAVVTETKAVVEPVAAPTPAAAPAVAPVQTPAPVVSSVAEPAKAQSAPVAATHINTGKPKPHASPSVRLFARELGVDMNLVSEGSGRKGRILKEDVKRYVKKAMTEGLPGASGGAGIPAIPAVDFSAFGEIETQKLSKIKRLTGQNMSRVWLNLPMVTYHDEADITDMEAFRTQLNSEKGKDEIKITGLLFIIKALVATLQQFPSFNASLSSDGENLILKKYCHIGIAVDTPNGLVVPVIRNANQKSIAELAAELAEKSAKARQGKLMPSDMQGGCMTISSLGGIGGTAFTPIVNAPEVAILGVTRAKMQPVWNGSEFVPRLMLPLDLTYDHRVIDGAEGARFMATLKLYLSDLRRLLL
ncbi:dihydrolipoyllysine-residue acetyltransferase [Methylocucumis oryzae]|uniref:Acetyltransferase component of pyruvate dehydrogenase complex n=1 Tax=Methylocucumis oryzae TaxID=1632867 RepID=A0A0F3IN78_9GAMM|nr:dihydrolipoyllysine-residue acetyltransferase [Methylocucumis oryzae]KJV07014.1 branched-chain alpha-keto acid dehydrogenase subunit E2 [Methylocucumis oryzae]